MPKRIDKIFADKKKKLVTFVTGGEPDQSTSQKILNTIINSGADIIEIGMPFSDPMADGPTIQLSPTVAPKIIVLGLILTFLPILHLFK